VKQKGNPVGLLQSIRRRDLIAMLSGVAVAWPLAAHGQQVGRTYRIAELAPFPRGGNKIQAAIFDELSRNGFVEGHNLIVDPRGFFVPPSEFEAVAVELVKAGPDALLPSGPEATLAAQHATQTIPIVAGLDDPLANKIVASMSHPGGNTTGVGIFATQLDAKRLEVLHEVVPTARRIGVLADAAMTSSRAQLANS